MVGKRFILMVIVMLSIIQSTFIFASAKPAASQSTSKSTTTKSSAASKSTSTKSTAAQKPVPGPAPIVTPTVTSPSAAGASGISQAESEDRNWFQKIGDGIKEILDNVKTLFKDGLKLLLEKTIGGILESYFILVAGGMSKWVFLTPTLYGFTWIERLWTICYIISIVILVAAVGFTILGTLAGKRQGKSVGGKLFLAVGIAFAGATLSFLIANVGIVFCNSVANSFAGETLWNQYNTAKSVYMNTPIVENGEKLTRETINFENFDGIQLCKMAFSGQLTSGPFYEVFLSAGGLIAMILSMIVMGLIGIFGLLRYLTIGVLAACGPIWFSFCGYTGDDTPAWGWFNLFFRTVILSAFFDLAWLFSVGANTNIQDFMGSQQLISTFLFLIALIIAIWFWFKWVVKAVMQPVTLAGASARESFGNAFEKIGKGVQSTGQRFGIHQLTAAGNSMQAKGKEHRNIAQEQKEGGRDYSKGKIKDRLKDVNIEAERKLIKHEGVVNSGFVAMDKKNIEVGGDLREVRVAGMDNDRLHSILKDSYGSIMHRDESGKVLIDDKFIDDAKSDIKASFEKDHISKGRGGITLKDMENDHLNAIEDKLTKKGVDYKKLDDGKLFVSNENKEKFMDSIVEFDEENAREYSDKKNYNSYQVKNQNDLIGITEALEKSLPKGSVMIEGKSILVESEHSQNVTKVIEEYSKRTPYWTEGNYYYYKDSQTSKVVPHLSPPEKGRYMGKR